MAFTREEALKILRTDPDLTEEDEQEMAKFWQETVDGKSEKDRC